MNATDLAEEKRRRAAADIEAALHYLHLAGEALHRAMVATPINTPFDDETTAKDLMRRSVLRTAAGRVQSAQRHTRKAKETQR